jgi:thiamine biosynthesis lipoprotein
MGSVCGQKKKYRFSANKMGSPFHITIICDDSLKAEQLANGSFRLVDSLVKILSDYDSTSELSRLSAHAGKGPQPVSSIMWNILEKSKQCYEISKGSFDVSIGALSHLWRKARKEKIFPDSLSIIEAKKKVGLNNMLLDPVHHTVTLKKPGMVLDMGGIGQGFIAQKVMNYLSQNKIRQALVDVSGDIVMSDAPDSSLGWLIGINLPEATEDLLPRKLRLHNMAVTTSGDVYQFIEHNGKKYSHIVDPRTGYGITSQRNVTVIAKNGTDADWLTKACSILPIAEARQVAAKMHADFLITEWVNGKIIYHQTKSFSKYWKP